ncbi:MAG: c-type cytochrome [Nitrospira sp.]|nr:c-type cytochrome [Nitrospira sp.]
MKKTMWYLGILSILAVGLYSSRVEAESLSGNPQKGEALYQQHCVGCHGTAGDGLGPDIKELIVPPANFRAPKLRTRTDMELYIAIKQGVLFSPMHGWADRLSDQEIRDVLRHIRSLAPFNPVG